MPFMVLINKGSSCRINRVTVSLQPFKRMIMELPEDPMMLFSVINMKLRDCYKSLDELCDDMNVNKETLIGKLESAGFEYNAEQNKFW